jgi:hypothetical protein
MRAQDCLRYLLGIGTRPRYQKMTRGFLIVLCFVTLAFACSATGNDEQAFFSKQGQRYLVEMKGRRRLMAHDPISALRATLTRRR